MSDSAENHKYEQTHTHTLSDSHTWKINRFCQLLENNGAVRDSEWRPWCIYWFSWNHIHINIARPALSSNVTSALMIDRSLLMFVLHGNDNWMLDLSCLLHLQSTTNVNPAWLFTFDFVFSPPSALDMQKSYVYFGDQSFFLPPLLNFFTPRLKMDSFHYASQQRAASAHAPHYKHTD